MSQEPDTGGYIQWLADPNRPRKERLQALGALQVAAMGGDRFDPYRSDYWAALRVGSEAEDEEIRYTCLQLLCMNKDRDTQKRLIASLDGSGPVLAPPVKALQFLSYDVHAGVFPIARQYADNPPNDEAQHEALRLLGSDPASTDLFAKILEDPAEDYEARSLSGICLRSLAPERYVAAGKKVMGNSADNADLRTEVLIGMVAVKTDPEDDELRELAKTVADDDGSNDSMKGSARRLLAQTPGTPQDGGQA